MVRDATKILVRGSKYAREELHQHEKPFVMRVRGKSREVPILYVMDNDTHEARHAFEFVAGPLRLISPWEEIYEVKPIESHMHDLVREAIRRRCFHVADDVIADMAFIRSRAEAARLAETRKDSCRAQTAH